MRQSTDGINRMGTTERMREEEEKEEEEGGDKSKNMKENAKGGE